EELPEFCYLANLPAGKQPPVSLHAIFQQTPRLLADTETTAHSAAFDAATQPLRSVAPLRRGEVQVAGHPAFSELNELLHHVQHDLDLDRGLRLHSRDFLRLNVPRQHHRSRAQVLVEERVACVQRTAADA